VNPYLGDQLIGYAYQGEDVYVYRKTFSSPSAGVMVGFRFGSEPCGTCYVPSFPPSVTIRHAATVVPSTSVVSRVSDFQVFVNFLLPYVTNNTRSASSFSSNAGYINFIVGFHNGESYMIKDCGFMAGGGSGQCSLPGTNRYQLWVTSPLVYGGGNITRQVYQINTDGSLGGYAGLGNSPAAPTGSYDVKSRAFFTIGMGWTNVNSVADVTATLNRRFAVASGQGFSGGIGDGILAVVGGEFLDNGDGALACTGSSSASTTIPAVFSILVVVLAAFRL